ncbi:MAG TPA: hypothetical protein VF103_03100 [Polyangiaceae bacterium]
MGLTSALIAWGSPAAAQEKPIGGHVGIAVPIVTIADETTTISDQFTILNPIGIGFKTSKHVIVDFETTVASPVDPAGTTGLVVDPGIVYDWGGVATGLRVAYQIGNKVNIGAIPLVNYGLLDLGGAKWFVEAAFPIFYVPKDVSLTIVAHTGIGF